MQRYLEAALVIPNVGLSWSNIELGPILELSPNELKSPSLAWLRWLRTLNGTTCYGLFNKQITQIHTHKVMLWPAAGSVCFLSST